MPSASGCSASIWSRVASSRYGAHEPLQRARLGHLPPQRPIGKRASILEYLPVTSSTVEAPCMGSFR